MDAPPQQRKRIKPFSFMIDGYFSVAEELVTIVKISKNFTLKDYEGKEEFYSKYFDYYGVLVDELISCSKEEIPKCISDMTKYILEKIEKSEATLTLFANAYFILIYHIDNCKFGQNRFIGEYGPDFNCEGSFESVKKMLSMNEGIIIPMVTPKGVYGVNSFLYCYFNNLFPIGITTNPLAVHGIEVGDSPILAIEHDLGHYSLISYRDKKYRSAEEKTYQYILDNQAKMDIGKPEALLWMMFMEIHEGGGFRENLRILKLYWYDWWKFLISNKYYTPEYLGIKFETNFRGMPIDITDHNSKWFKAGMTNSIEFHKQVQDYLQKFCKTVYKDYTAIRNIFEEKN